MRKARSYGVKDVSREIKEEIKQQELRVLLEKSENEKDLTHINKSVVLKTNKSDSNYISMTEEKFNRYVEYLEDNKNNKIHLVISFYKTNEDKKNQIRSQGQTLNIKRLEKMGVRSYNKKDPSKNTYRVKYFTEVV